MREDEAHYLHVYRWNVSAGTASPASNHSDIAEVPSLSTTEVISFSIAMSLCICLTVIGNVLVILSIFTYKPLRSVQNIYIISLACADLTVALLVMPFHIVNYALDGRWVFGIVFCNVWLTADILACTASILNLCGIALDRYKAIHDPINYAQRRSMTRVLGNIAGIWIVSVIISAPPLIGWNNSSGRSLYDDVTQKCHLTDHPGFVIYSAAGSFYIPLALMTFVYVNIYMATRARLRARSGARRKKSKKSKISENSKEVIVKYRSKDHSAGKSVNGGSNLRNGFVTDWLRMRSIKLIGSYRRSSSKVENNDIRASSYPDLASRPLVYKSSNNHLLTVPVSHIDFKLEEAINKIGTNPEEKSELYNDNPFRTVSLEDCRTSPGQYNPVPFTGFSQGQNTIEPINVNGGSSGNLVYIKCSGDATAENDLNGDDDRERLVDENLRKAGLLLDDNIECDVKRQQLGVSSYCNSMKGGKNVTNLEIRRARDVNKAARDVTNFTENSSLSVPLASLHQSSLASQRPKTRVRRNRRQGSVETNRSANSEARRESSSKLSTVSNSSRNFRSVLSERQRISLAKERRIAHTMAIIMIAFVVCWLPFFVMYVVVPFCKSCSSRVAEKVEMFVVWLGYFNSTLNPAIYTVFNIDFRRAFAILLRVKSADKNLPVSMPERSHMIK